MCNDSRNQSLSNQTHILQRVRSHTLRERQAIHTSHHYQYVGPRTLEQRTSLKTRPGKILHAEDKAKLANRFS